MAYSHIRLQRTLAVVRMLTGVMFLVLGAYKVSSLDFAQFEFPRLIWNATHGAAAGFYASYLNNFIGSHPARYAVLVGLAELFIGVGLVLGLAVRPVSLIGMLYSVNLALATWRVPGEGAPTWQYLDNEAKLILLFCLFLLFGIGHAGENWGLGALYHRRRLGRSAAAEQPVHTLHPMHDTDFQHYSEADELLRDWELSRRPLQHGSKR